MPADCLVKITDINFAYDDRAILKGINMEIPRGQLVAIIAAYRADIDRSGRNNKPRVTEDDVAPTILNIGKLRRADLNCSGFAVSDGHRHGV